MKKIVITIALFITTMNFADLSAATIATNDWEGFSNHSAVKTSLPTDFGTSIKAEGEEPEGEVDCWELAKRLEKKGHDFEEVLRECCAISSDCMNLKGVTIVAKKPTELKKKDSVNEKKRKKLK